MKELILKNGIRVQVLSHEIIRIEQSYEDHFCDQDTFFIPNKTIYEGIDFCYQEKEEYYLITFDDYELHVPKEDELHGLVLMKNDEIIYNFTHIENTGELPKPHLTPMVFAINDTPRIIAPKHGYSKKSFENNENYIVEENNEDLYLLLCNKDHRLLRKLYVELTGRVDLVRMQTLGLWNSKYYKYHQYEIYDLISKYQKLDIPLDNVVIDTDWRKANDIGIGYEIDKLLFPHMKNIFDYSHDYHIAVMFNDHPQPFENVCNVLDPKEVDFREKNLTYLLELGLDTWWYDRNWSTKLISPTKRINPETMGAYLFHDITKHHYQKQMSKDKYVRPDIMSNCDNIEHGKYRSITNSASHRYQIQWTGDINSGTSNMYLEIQNLIKASENEISYVNFDCGGHMGNPDNKLYTKWMKFGAFTPILRPHCTKNLLRSREPWVYNKRTLDTVREYIKMRYRLMPYIYSCFFENYQTGEPAFKSLEYEFSNDEKTYGNDDTYLMGHNIMVSPLYGGLKHNFDEKYFMKKPHLRVFGNKEMTGKPIVNMYTPSINYDWQNDLRFKNVPLDYFSCVVTAKVKTDKDITLFVASDDGARVYVDDKLILDDWTTHGILETEVCLLKKNQEYKLRIEYFQETGSSFLGLSYCEDVNRKDVYIPGCSWIDSFTGQVYEKGKTYKFFDKFISMPILIKEGSIIPLVESKPTTTELDYSNIVLDYYPSMIVDSNTYLYEDDRRTTGYKLGEYRTTDISTFYHKEDNKLIVDISKANGAYEDEIKARDILFKMHLLNECAEVEKVLINQEEVEFKLNSKLSSGYPFTCEASSINSDTLSFNFKEDISKDYHIEIYLK